jgi:peptide/nickel transport system permease protein
MLWKRKITADAPASQWGMAWLRFKRNRLAMGAMCFIILMCAVAILGYLITPDSTPYANDQKPELHIREPGFKGTFLKVWKNEVIQPANFISRMLFGENPPYDLVPVSAYKFSGPDILIEEYSGEKATGKFTAGFNIADVLYAVGAANPIAYDSVQKTITWYDVGSSAQKTEPVKFLQDQILKQSIVTKSFLLGTDRLGRDMLSRLIIGTRISLTVGLISVLISLFVGILLGAIAGYFRGTVDAMIMWLINVVWSIPTLLLVIAITLVLGKGVTQVFIAVGLTMWVDVARVVRGQVIGIREREFVEAARALGYSNNRIILRHILPNVMGPVLVMAASNFATAILMEAGLSFLGLGAQPPIPSWGEMTSAHHGYILMDKAYLAFMPGACIMLLVLSFMITGNGLRDALDARSADIPPGGA